MLLSTFQFITTILLAMVCARALGLSGGDMPFIAFIIPALWLLSRSGFSGVILLLGVLGYALTIPYQPASLSVSMWVIFPLLMVVFSHPRNMPVIAVGALIVITLEVGIMVTQSAGKLSGTPAMTMVQILAMGMIWWSAASWKPTQQHSWWPLALIVPLWVSGLQMAAVLALCLTGLVAVIESLSQQKKFQWGKLLCWTLPSVGFMAVILSPEIDVPNPVFVVWLCLLATAWMTDYILKSNEEQPL